MNTHKKITILGGGIIGISNAIVFAERGFEVEIISEAFLWEDRNTPTFASLYPAASILPHSIEGDTQQLFQYSKVVFDQMSKTHPELVRWQLHFEINEHKAVEKADYCAQMDNFQEFQNEKYQQIAIPKRNKNIPVFGHAFQVMFVEMVAYKQYLKERVKALKIQITYQKLSSDFFKTAPKGIYINALSFFGKRLVADPKPIRAKAGVLLCVNNTKRLVHSELQQTISYNYTWGDGLEVYTYPRNGSMILGGTRYILDDLNDVNQQLQAQIPAANLKFKNGLPYPSYLIDVNQRLLKQLYGYDLNIQDNDFEVLIGLRPVREGGVNMAMEKINGSIILNSYGFGGAGVTLSWGCALENFKKVENLY